MTVYELIGTIVAIIGVILTIIVVSASYMKYRDNTLVKRTQQDCKLDSIVENVTTIRDDVKTLKGLDIKVEQLCTRVAHVERATNTAHRRLDKHMGVEREVEEDVEEC